MNRLRDERKAAGLTQKQLADCADTSQAQIVRLEKSERKLTKEWAERLAPCLKLSAKELLFGRQSVEVGVTGLRVEGVSEAGTFRDISLQNGDEADMEVISVAEDARFPRAKQYALLIHGDSMNKHFPDGCYVTCVNFADTGLELKSGMIVHVERVRGSLVETTIKAYEVRGPQKFLVPKSTNRNHADIEINGDEDTEIIVRGIVTGSWNPIKI